MKQEQYGLDPLGTGFEEFDQAIEIAKLEDWLQRVAKRRSQELLCRAISKFAELDVLRYARCDTGATRCGFAAVWRSRELDDFVDNSLIPIRPAVAAMLRLLADGSLVMNIGERKGRPEFIFYAARMKDVTP